PPPPPLSRSWSVPPRGTQRSPSPPRRGAHYTPVETPLALPAPFRCSLARTTGGSRTKTPGPVGSFGPGWKMPADIRLQLRDNTLILSGNGGRSLYFEHLFPGEDGYSRSESLWL
ncbi:DUF6531 domain-containing protein, partial [Escherichia coli]|uniref:DUF6531 domain-containing protein n=1 Tax=Escherichia coli TaxID=562 RepID=UPI0020254BD7